MITAGVVEFTDKFEACLTTLKYITKLTCNSHCFHSWWTSAVWNQLSQVVCRMMVPHWWHYISTILPLWSCTQLQQLLDWYTLPSASCLTCSSGKRSRCTSNNGHDSHPVSSYLVPTQSAACCVVVQKRIRMGNLSKSVQLRKFETRRNLLPVLKIVTCTVQLHIDV